MEPRIQYAKTSDGVNIAFAIVGSGPPLVFASTIWGSLHMARSGLDAVTGGFWSMKDLLATGRTIVLYDHRGSGSSDRGVDDYSLEGRVRDLDAVVNRVDIPHFPLIGFGHGATTAIAYAVSHPEAVAHLILVNAFVSGAEYYRTVPAMRALKAMQGMAEEEWEYFTQSLATGTIGFNDTALADKLAKGFQGGMRPPDLFSFREVAEAIDVGDLLPRVSVPTLVIRDDSVQIGQELARDVAAGIPGAQFVVTTDQTGVVRDFLSSTTAAPSSDPLPSGTAIILFADIVDSAALTERLGDTAFRDKARTLDEAMRAAIRDNGGTPIEGKTLGDGVLAVFTSAKQAIACARACHDAAGAAGLSLHAGIHAGDVIREADNVYGGAVNIAARIAAASAAGETLVSATVRELARTSAGVVFEDRGEQALKGVGEPVRVWAVRQA